MPLVPMFFAGSLKNQAGQSSPWSGPTEQIRSDGSAITSLFDSRDAAEILRSLGPSGAWTEKPSVVDGRQRTNCSAAISTTHRKRADQISSNRQPGCGWEH